MLIGAELAKLIFMNTNQKSFSNFQFVFLSVAILIPTALLIFRNQHYFNSHWLNKLQSTAEYYQELLHDIQLHNNDIITKLAVIDPKILEVHSKTNELEEFIEVLKRNLVDASGGVDSHKKDIIDKFNLEGTQSFLIGENNHKGEAYKLELKLNDYADYLSRLSGNPFPPIALDGKSDTKIFHGDGDQSNKDFVELNFGNCNVIESLAVLTELQLKIVSYEQQYIQMQVVKYLTDSTGANN